MIARVLDAPNRPLCNQLLLVVQALLSEEVLLRQDFGFHRKNKPQKKDPFNLAPPSVLQAEQTVGLA